MGTDFERRLATYKTTMSIIKSMIETGIISEEEYSMIDTIIAEKYGFNSCSIYRETA